MRHPKAYCNTGSLTLGSRLSGVLLRMNSIPNYICSFESFFPYGTSLNCLRCRAFKISLFCFVCLPRSALRAHHPELVTGACAMQPSWLHTRLWKTLRFLTGFCTALQSGSLFFNSKPFHILSDLYPSQQTPRHSPSEISNCLKAFPHFLCCKHKLLHPLSLTLSPSLHPVFPLPPPPFSLPHHSYYCLQPVFLRRSSVAPSGNSQWSAIPLPITPILGVPHHTPLS